MRTPNTIARSGLRIVRGERFNGFSHLLGLLLSLAAGALLVDEAVMKGDAAASVGAAVFSLASVLLYAASTLYHFTQGAAKAIWRRADHCAIYLMIAGTYTPFGLLTWNGPRAAVAIGAIWGLAAVGIVRELRAGPGAPPSLLFYLGLGWLTVLATFPLAAALDGLVLAGLLAGAGCYSFGTIFYRNRRNWRHAHGTWHLFVLAGSACHYGAIVWAVQ